MRACQLLNLTFSVSLLLAAPSFCSAVTLTSHESQATQQLQPAVHHDAEQEKCDRESAVAFVESSRGDHCDRRTFAAKQETQSMSVKAIEGWLFEGAARPYCVTGFKFDGRNVRVTLRSVRRDLVETQCFL
jgi:hypothetical protein